MGAAECAQGACHCNCLCRSLWGEQHVERMLCNRCHAQYYSVVHVLRAQASIPLPAPLKNILCIPNKQKRNYPPQCLVLLGTLLDATSWLVLCGWISLLQATMHICSTSHPGGAAGGQDGRFRLWDTRGHSNPGKVKLHAGQKGTGAVSGIVMGAMLHV